MIIFNNNGLVGDAVAALPAIWETANHQKVYLVSSNKEVESLLFHHENIKIINEINNLFEIPDLTNQKNYVLDAGRNMAQFCCQNKHMTQGYYSQLGLPIPNDVPICPLTTDSIDSVEVYDFIISASSRSDDRNNKLVPYDRWQIVINWLREQNYSVAVVMSNRPDEHKFDNCDNIVGQPLKKVGAYLRAAKQGFLGIDNGVQHLSRLLQVPSVQFYPVCLPLTWVKNTNPNALVVQNNPLNFTPEIMINYIKQFIQN
jgi:hypothetical protein